MHKPNLLADVLEMSLRQRGDLFSCDDGPGARAEEEGGISLYPVRGSACILKVYVSVDSC